MVLIPQTFNGTGADLSGSSGDSNRVLTLNNTQLTKQRGFLVYASGLALGLTTEYTVSHLSASSTVTFLNPIWDDLTIVVSYFEQSSGLVYSTMREDFQGIVTDNGRELTLIRQTETTGSMGDVKTVSEAEYTIWTLIQDITRKDRQIHEMGLAVPGNSKAFFFHEYPDSITGNGTVSPEPGDIIKDENSKSWRIEEIISQHQGDNNEIFRTGIIKNIELS